MVGERPLILHVAAVAAEVCPRVTVVSRRDYEYADLGLPTIGDLRPGLGPLGGLYTALAHLPAGARGLLLLACDNLDLRPGWLRELLAAGDDERGAAAFRADRWHPLPGLYRRRVGDLARRRLERGRLSMQELLDRAGTLALPLPEGWRGGGGVNSPADLPGGRG